MENVFADILATLRQNGALENKDVEKILRKHSKLAGGPTRAFSKKQLMPYFLNVRNSDPERWAAWGITPDEEKALVPVLRLKPRRTASGVATITVITKPWPCSSNCLYCPNDMRMPKSYLADEPACQRAERNHFDPYLQVAARLRTLTQMGHITDKVELIVLGGTWCDYPREYQIWFVEQLFAALNDPDGVRDAKEHELRERYARAGFTTSEAELQAFAADAQRQVDAGDLTYNAAFKRLYADNPRWKSLAEWQCATFPNLDKQHAANEDAAHRMVGLVIETRPDTLDPKSVTLIRRLGCTKVQMGVQSVNEAVLAANNRSISVGQVQRAFELLRLFGFKTHTHFMANLLGSTPQMDKADYATFVSDPRFSPDEVKLYPCVLLGAAELRREFDRGTWAPYTDDELLDLLVEDTVATPAHTRISRMIRDFSAPDIIAGNTKTNLRQLVEERAERSGRAIQEIRHREVAGLQLAAADLRLTEHPYETTVTSEVFLQWVTPDNKIAGFLRLSMPKPEAFAKYPGQLPIQPDEAMIREVHVYGKVASLGESESQPGSQPSVQHIGLGKQLIERACEIAKENGYRKINVISAIGTRNYYRARGFTTSVGGIDEIDGADDANIGDNASEGMYQQRKL